MARHSKHAATAAGNNVDGHCAQSKVVTSNGDAWRNPMDRQLEMARECFNASLASSRRALQGFDEWQQAHHETMQALSGRVGQMIAQAERAPDWPALLEAQAQSMATQLDGVAQDFGALFQRMVEIETQLIEQSQLESSELTQRLVQAAASQAHHPAYVPAITPMTFMAPSANDNPALAMMGNAQAALTEMTRLWSESVKSATEPAPRQH